MCSETIYGVSLKIYVTRQWLWVILLLERPRIGTRGETALTPGWWRGGGRGQTRPEGIHERPPRRRASSPHRERPRALPIQGGESIGCAHGCVITNGWPGVVAKVLLNCDVMGTGRQWGTAIFYLFVFFAGCFWLQKQEKLKLFTVSSSGWWSRTNTLNFLFYFKRIEPCCCRRRAPLCYCGLYVI